MKWKYITRYHVFDISRGQLVKEDTGYFSEYGYDSREEAQQAIINRDTSRPFYIVESFERVPDWD